MAIAGVEQPQFIQVDEQIRLRKFDGSYEFAFDWYQDIDTVYLVDGVKAPYTWEKLRQMYEYLNQKGELYFIEYREGTTYFPIGDVTFWKEDMPIVIGDRRYRGKGVGKRVIQALVNRGRERGFSMECVNEIYEYNIASKKCFESVGFEVMRKTEKGYRMMLANGDYSNVRIETKDLVLRKSRQTDWKAIYRNIWSHEESARYMQWNTTTEEEAIRRMERTIKWQKCEKYALTIALEETDEAIGWAGMQMISPDVYEECGVAIGPEFVHKGYGKQILNALLEEAFHGNGAKEFCASCWKDNVASHMLQMACGFETTGYEDKVSPKTGEHYVMEYNRKVREKE